MRVACLILLVGCGDDTAGEGRADPSPTAPSPKQAGGSVPSPQRSKPAPNKGDHAKPAPKGGNAQAAALPASQTGGLTWEAVEPLVGRAPRSRMRAAEYAVAGAAPDTGAEMTVYYFGPGQGGSVEANLDRWIGQFTRPDKKPSRDAAKIEKHDVGGVRVTTLDLEGTFAANMGPMMKATPKGGNPGYRVLGAIAEGPDGPVFFKLVGPKATVEMAEAAFYHLVESIKPAG